jgi:hypothetical protein
LPRSPARAPAVREDPVAAVLVNRLVLWAGHLREDNGIGRGAVRSTDRRARKDLARLALVRHHLRRPARTMVRRREAHVGRAVIVCLLSITMTDMWSATGTDTT